MAKLKSSPLKSINVEQDKKGIFTISWESREKDIGVNIFAGDSPSTINRKASVASVKGKTSVKIDGLDPGVRHYFELVPEGGQGIMCAGRHQPFEGIVNFRDLGGYQTTDGRRVKWGQIFRSGHLSNTSQKDKALFQKMGIQIICDFRSQGEKDAQPNWLPEDGSTTYHQYPIVHGEFDPVAAMESLQKGDISWLTEDFIINVPEDTVINDHGLSNVYIADALKMINKRIKALGIDPDDVAPYFTAPRNAIIALVNHVRKTYGSAADYLKANGGVSQTTLNELKRQLLE
jgi:protein-tyrosine phosphatase